MGVLVGGLGVGVLVGVGIGVSVGLTALVGMGVLVGAVLVQYFFSKTLQVHV
mgnify:CR=1 FL=1